MNPNTIQKAWERKRAGWRLTTLGLAAVCGTAMVAPAAAQRIPDSPVAVTVERDFALEGCALALGRLFAPPRTGMPLDPSTQAWLRGLAPSEPQGEWADCVTVEAEAGVVSRDVGGAIGLGTLPGVAGAEPLFSAHDGWLWGAEARFGINYATESLSLGWTGFYSGLGGSASTSEPIGGAPVAYTFGADSFGSTGLFLGATGADAKSSISASAFGMEMDFLMRDIDALRHLYGADVPATGETHQWAVGLTGLYSHATLDHSGTFQSLAFPDISSEVSRTLTSDVFGIGPKFALYQNFGNDWFVTLGADMKVVWRHSWLDSLEEITCGGCGGLPPAFDIAITDSVSGVDWLAGFDLTVGYEISPKMVLTLGAGLDVGGRDTIRVRANPAEPATGIGAMTGIDTKWMAGFIGRF